MALPEFAKPAANDAPAPLTVPAPLPAAALKRLPELHDESRLALRRASLMARAVPAAGSLLLLGTLTAMFGGGPLAPTFLWSLLVLAGVVAVLASHLRATSVFKDLAGSAADMRAILLYLGAAWGAGAFLAMAPQAAALVLFAAVPSLVVARLLGDLPAILAFTAPATFLTFAALVLRTGNMGAAAILMLFQAGCGFWLLRSRTHLAGPGPG
ncbi:MAG: hypothetical protein JO256_10800 [Alphaproteobacteria bacterium]|nr:hypothetical protein [Alphaproteobacteria bacterium]